MTNSVQRHLYHNVSFMQAFDVAIKNKAASVEFDGSNFLIGNEAIPAKQDTFSKVRSVFMRVIYALCRFFSCSYNDRFYNATKLFDKAFEEQERKELELSNTPSTPVEMSKIEEPVHHPLEIVQEIVQETKKPIAPLPAPLPAPVTIALNTASQQFLTALEKSTSVQMRQIWEGILSNLSTQFKDNVVLDFKQDTIANTIVLVFKKNIHFWLPTTDDNGDLAPQAEPHGGILFTFGDENRELVFKAHKSNQIVELKVLSGWDVMARLPDKYRMALKVATFGLIPDWIEAKTFSMSISDNKVSTVGGTSFKKADPVIKPFEKTLLNWTKGGELFTPKKSALLSENKVKQAFLAKKRVACGFAKD